MSPIWQSWKEREAAREAAQRIEVHELPVQEIECTTVAEPAFVTREQDGSDQQ